MKAVILDGSQANDNTGQRVREALMAQLQSQGWEVEHFALCDQKIGNCAGDFFCWICTPGVCVGWSGKASHPPLVVLAGGLEACGY